MIEAIIFDLDDTLVDRNASMRWALAEQYDKFKEYFLGINKTDYVNEIVDLQKHGYINTIIAYNEYYEKHNAKGLTVQDLNDDINSRYGIKTILFDNVIEILELLKNEYRLSIITNGKIEWQYRKIKQSGLKQYFEVITISEEVGYEKPDRNIFNICLQKMGIKPENSIYIGDNPEMDIKPALGLGMKTIWKDNGYFDKPIKSNALIKGYNDLISEIRKIENEEI